MDKVYIRIERYLVAYIDRLAKEGARTRSDIVRNIISSRGLSDGGHGRDMYKDAGSPSSRYKEYTPRSLQR